MREPPIPPAGQPSPRRAHQTLDPADAGTSTAPPTAASPDFNNQDQPLLREGPGADVGRYRIVRQIGQGGMGVVFVAEQERPIRRTVALKIIKPGMDSREVVARFEAERQALAAMDHSGIAKVLDAGVTETGRPSSAQLLLGKSLTMQSRYAEAEPFALAAFQTFTEKVPAYPVRQRDAVEAIILLYEKWAKPEQAATWRRKLDALRAATVPTSRPTTRPAALWAPVRYAAGAYA